eukprot:TRINITY_DN59748_c0_g1_i1.p1 TRINITY_DN59748_c0_g1~~TRINITY_DN59748_c0_g1_i1.p1  ORF type:complete len:199 (-),score=33.68 TRINITY_DN59748_c0_g1_i1:423-1019(-)
MEPRTIIMEGAHMEAHPRHAQSTAQQTKCDGVTLPEVSESFGVTVHEIGMQALSTVEKPPKMCSSCNDESTRTSLDFPTTSTHFPIEGSFLTCGSLPEIVPSNFFRGSQTFDSLPALSDNALATSSVDSLPSVLDRKVSDLEDLFPMNVSEDADGVLSERRIMASLQTRFKKYEKALDGSIPEEQQATAGSSTSASAV